MTVRLRRGAINLKTADGSDRSRPKDTWGSRRKPRLLHHRTMRPSHDAWSFRKERRWERKRDRRTARRDGQANREAYPALVLQRAGRCDLSRNVGPRFWR